MIDHECCPCAERLRAQNKASSDAWTRRTADLQSRHDGLVHAFDEARAAIRALADSPGGLHGGLQVRGASGYITAIVAAALDEADQAKLDLAMVQTKLADERRSRRYAEERYRLDVRARARERQRRQVLNEEDNL